MIDNPDVDQWRQRLAILLAGLDPTARNGSSAVAFEAVEEAARETSLAGLRRIASGLGYRGIAARSRDEAVAKIVSRWWALPAAERVAPASTLAERREAAGLAMDHAADAMAAVGTPGEAAAVERLRALVEWLAGVTPGLGS